jgi:hypothetical protein
MDHPLNRLRQRRSVAFLLGVLALTLTACQGETRNIGSEAPTRDWPGSMPCPPSLEVVCADRQLRLRETINEPRGTMYGVASDDVFVICRWPQPAPGPECEAIPSIGAEVAGEAAIYRVES